MKDKLLAIFVRFAKSTFSKERLRDLISDLLDVLYEKIQQETVEEVMDDDVENSV